MDFSLTEEQLRIRDAIREVCARFPGTYWRELEASGAYPREFVDALTELGWLSILIPEEHGGGGLGITEACVVLEEIHRSGGNANACHAQMYTMGALLRGIRGRPKS
jgi:acyl-CoA dehydrogenase